MKNYNNKREFDKAHIGENFKRELSEDCKESIRILPTGSKNMKCNCLSSEVRRLGQDKLRSGKQASSQWQL